MTGADYILFSLMIYATSFIFVYVSQVIYETFIEHIKKYRSFFGGAVFGVSLGAVIYLVEQLGLTGLPDGRFTIVMLSTSFFGLIGGGLTFTLVLIASIANNYYEVTFLVLNLLNHLLIGIIVYFVKKKNGKVHLFINMLAAVIGIVLAGVLSRYFVETAHDLVFEINSNMHYIVILVAVFAGAISMEIIGEERKRERHKELVNQRNQLRQVISESEALNEQLLESERKYKLTMQASDEGFVEYNHFTKTMILSERTMHIFDHLLIGKESTLWNVFDLMHPGDANYIQEEFAKLKASNDEMFDFKVRIKQKSGSFRHIRFTGAVIRSGKGISKIVGTVKDIHNQVLKEEMIFNLAYKDEVTNFYNENAFIKDINEHNAKGYKGHLLFLALRDYAGYNTLGIEFKNRIRKQLSDVLKRHFRFDDCYYLQNGVFVIKTVDAMGYDETHRVFSKLVSELDKPMVYEELTIPLLIHAMFMSYPMDHISVEGIITRALSIMNYAENKNKFSLEKYDEEIYNNHFRLNHLDTYINNGLENNEFYMMYQPQYNNEQVVTGYEALIRWKSEQYGMVSPAEFIPIAEKYGSIYRIGEFVTASACDFMNKYYDKFGIYPRVSINVSFMELINPDYANDLFKIIQNQNIPVQKFVLEITETAISEYINTVVRNVGVLKSYGFEIHLDDFGTGYSSLSHLSSLEVDLIKIDKTFIDRIETDKVTRSIVVSSIDMAHRIGKGVIAEGIEEEEQFDILKELGCDEYQGYYFNKPLNVDEIVNKD